MRRVIGSDEASAGASSPATVYHVYDLPEALRLTLTPRDPRLRQRLLRHALNAF